MVNCHLSSEQSGFLKYVNALGKGGVAAPSTECREATETGADGVVRSTYPRPVSDVDRTTPNPSFAKEGKKPFPCRLYLVHHFKSIRTHFVAPAGNL